MVGSGEPDDSICCVMRRGCRGGFGFFVEGFGFGVLFAQTLYDVGGGFGHEGVVVELTVCGFEAFFVFGEVFGETLALGGDVDLALVDDGHVEVGGAAGVGAGERVGGEVHGVHASQRMSMS